MATTVTYKGATLATVENQTKTLQTAGTWCEDDFTLTDVSGGGGGDVTHWQRPSEFPDYAQLDISNEEACYYTYFTNTDNSFVSIQITATGSYTVSIGTIANGSFNALETETFTSSATYSKALTGYDTDYVVLRIAGTITKLKFVAYETENIVNSLRTQSCVEIYGRVPHLGDCNEFARFMTYIESITLIDAYNISSLQRFGADTKRLANVDISGVTNRITGYLAFGGANGLRYLYLHGIKLSNVQGICGGTKLMYSDLEDWDVVASNSMAQSFGSVLLKKLDLSGWNITTTSLSGIFLDCIYLEEVDISTWTMSGSAQTAFRNTALKHFPEGDFSNINNIVQMFYHGSLIGHVTFPQTQATSFAESLQYCETIKAVTIPANYTTIPANCFRDTYNLQEIHFLATTPPTLANSNAFTTNTNSMQKIYVPYSSDHSVLSAYQSATNWSTLASRIVEESV